ncbi:MAG: glycosyltransferase family 4 protein, partial [Calditrichaeota bacterium]|nr:glycosyltransferase family 4 protein [Calditrichota bacterium]
MRDFSSWLHEKENVELFLALQKGSRLHQALEPLKAPGMLFRKSTGKVALSRAWSLADFIRINEIDVVHVHWKFDLPVVALARKLSGKKFLFVHTRQMNMPGKKTDPYHRFVYGQLDAFIAITRYIENQAHVNLPIHSDKIFQIYYGFSISSAISHDRIKELKSRFGITGKFTVGLLGRISEYKGQHLLIEAVEQLNREGLPVHAFIVGAPFEPVYCRQLHQMVLDKALQEQVRFIDFYE